MKINNLKNEWENITLHGKINLFLGFMLIFLNILSPGVLTLNIIGAIVGLTVMWVGSQSKIEPHPEYQKKLTDFQDVIK